jgi:integrase
MDGKDISITRDTEKEAVAEAMAIKVGIKKENKVENITLRKAIDKYIDDRSSILSPSTVRGYRTLQANRFQGIMDMPIAKLDTRAIQKAVNVDAKAVGAKTLKNAIGLLSGAMGYYGVEIGKLTLPEQQKVEKEIYTTEELRKLLDAIRGTDSEIVVLLAAWLGMRRSEILGLRWTSIDYEKGTVSVTEAIVPGEGHKLTAKGTKTAASKRVVSCPQYILDVFKRTEPKGERVVTAHPATIDRRLNKICNSIDIPYIGLHAMRHQNASTMLLLNVPDKYVMERGGWSNIATPKSIYQHTMDEGRTAADLAIDGYFEKLITRDPVKYKLSPGGIPKRKPPKKFKIKQKLPG